MSETLKFGNGQWAVKEGSALAYNDTNGNYKPLPFTFDRAGSATRVNKQGLIEVVPNNEPRIDFLNDSNGALLLEPSRSNLITYSEDFNGTGWAVFGASGGTCTRTLNYGISPQGIQNSTRVVFSNSNTALYFNTSISVSSVATIYVKGVAGEIIGFGFGSSVADGSDFTFNGEWQRLEFSGSSGGSVTINTWLAAANARDFEIWGAQLEQGSYATSYIPTQGSIGTRNRELSDTQNLSHVIGQTEGVIFYDAILVHKSTSTAEDLFELSIDDGSNQNIFFINNYNNSLTVGLLNGGSYQFTNNSFNPTEGARYKLAFAYKQNDFALYINGNQIATSSSGTVPTMNQITFGNYYNNSANFSNSVKVNEFKLYSTRLSNAELQALTTI